MTDKRLKQLIDCILAEIIKTWDGTKEEYLRWLELEVGMTPEEISKLYDEGYLPIPNFN